MKRRGEVSLVQQFVLLVVAIAAVGVSLFIFSPTTEWKALNEKFMIVQQKLDAFTKEHEVMLERIQRLESAQEDVIPVTHNMQFDSRERRRKEPGFKHGL